MTKLTFKNSYSERKEKPEFYTKYDEDCIDLTDQSQACQASIVEMAKKFGIDAIIARAEQTMVNDAVKDRLYGHDFTNMFNSVEETLNVKKKISNLFENIPARIRKEMFKDDITEFLNAYTSNDETKLKALNQVGIVSDTQLYQAKQWNQENNNRIAENNTRKAFIDKLETMKEGLYEIFKETGNINLNNNSNNAESN